MKKRLPIIVMIILIIASMFVLASCSDGVSPVESIVISTLPKTTYYKGDAFILDDAELTVYYQNGRSEIIPLEFTMVSNFDAQLVGDQILTISYGGKTRYLKITVTDAPIQTIELGSEHKAQYVQGQTLDTSNMTINVTYTNGFTETVSVTEDMITGFNPNILGEQEVTLSYTKNGQTVNKTLTLTVIRKEIEKVELIAPDKINYVVGQSLDLTGGALKLYYNDNTNTQVLFSDIYGKDNNFKIKVPGSDDLEFTQASAVQITVNYYDWEKVFGVIVEEVRVKQLELVKAPNDQIKNATLDLSSGIMRVIYNNGDTENVALNDSRVTNYIDSSLFDINKVGTYKVRFEMQGVSLDVDINVIEAKEDELIIILPDVIYYQATGDINYTTWKYSIRLTNGSCLALDHQGNTEAFLTNNEDSFVKLDKDFNNNFSTAEVGIKTYKFVYLSADRRTELTKTVSVNVVKKELVKVEYFKAPNVTTYMQDDTLKLEGGEIQFSYNSGELTPIIPLTRDMFEDSVWENATSQPTLSKTITLTYKDVTFQTSIYHSFDIKVLQRIEKVAISSSSTHKTTGVQGRYFDYSNLVLDVTYPNGTNISVQDFDSDEWTIVNDYFAEIGIQEVKVYYGDANDVSNDKFITIPVTVTNNIIRIKFEDGYLDENGYGFDDIIEGQTVSIKENAYILVEYENNDMVDQSLLRVKVTPSMLPEAMSYNLSVGQREVVITYDGLSLTAYVNVLDRKIGSVRLVEQATKLRYAKEDSLSLDGIRVAITYDNGAVSYISLKDDQTIYDINKNMGTERFTFTASYDNTWQDGVSFMEKEITLTINLLINDTLDGGQDSIAYTTYWFDKLPERIMLMENDQTLPTISACESVDEIIFPKDAMLSIIYENGQTDNYYLNEYYKDEPNYLSSDMYQLIGFDSNSVHNQTVIFSYLLYQCTFSVDVKPKVLVGLSADKTSISVIEGMQLDSEAVTITAHYVDAEGREFNNDYGQIKIELADLESTYDHTAPVTFTNGQFITTVTFSFGGKFVELELMIYQKTLSSIALIEYPKQVYYEFHTEGLSLSGGKLMAFYNNNTSELIDLESGLSSLSIDSHDFINSLSVELNNGNEVSKNIYISYTVNGVEKTTSYIVTIKDREYLTVEFSDKSTVRDGAYQLIYGATASSRPHFYVMHGAERFISNENIDEKIAENSGFTVMYRDGFGFESAEFPINAGIYTIVIRYDGDSKFNALIDESMKIHINKRKIYINANAYQSTYGDIKPEFSFNITSGEIDDNVLVFGQTDSDVLSVAYDVYLNDIKQVFENGVVSFNISSALTEYKIRPRLDMPSTQYDNYQILEYVEAVYTVNPLPIIISALAEEKIYGQPEPAYRYDVFLSENGSKGAKIGGKERINGSVVASININGHQIDINSYNLTRNLTAQNVGQHDILKGSDNILSNFNIVSFESNKLTIKKKDITVVGQPESKEYGHTTPYFTFSTKNADDLINSANLGILDTFDSVFGAYAKPENYVLEIYSLNDVEKNNNLALGMDGKGVPYNTAIGEYLVYLIIDNELIENYNVTVEPLTLTIVKTDVKVFAFNMLINYGDSDPVYQYNAEAPYDIEQDIQYGPYYWYEFSEGFLLDESDLICNFTRETGKDIGKYKLQLTAQTYGLNTNYNITLCGQDIESPYSYIYIYPRPISINRTADQETYAKKAMSEFAAPYTISAKDQHYTILPDDISGIEQAISFSFKGRTDRVQGTGFVVVDTYDGVMTYDYLSNINFYDYDMLMSLAQSEIDRFYYLVDRYIFDDIDFTADEVFKQKDSFVYAVTPKPLDIEVTNLSTYNFDNHIIALSYNDLSSELFAGDTITITPEITAVYEGQSQSVSATSLYNAGEYTIKIADIGNFNYIINNVDYTKIIKIMPIEIKVVIKGAKLKEGEYYYTSSVYDGNSKNPYDTLWVSNIDENGQEKIAGEGYYYTEDYKIVSSGLAGAPNSLTIYPYTIDTNGNNVYPINAGEYMLMVNISETYKNYTVKFVSPTDYDQPAEYRYIIEKRVVQILNLEKYNSHEYNETAPSIPSNAVIFVDNDVQNELINVATDITFTFERDMSSVPEYLRDYINEQDRISAGYFTITVNYSKSNNYEFDLLDVQHYIIRRKNIEVLLNTSTDILNKQFDTLKPTASASNLNLIGGTASSYYFDVDGVYLDINVMAFWNSQTNAWTETIPSNYPVGYYAYTITPKIKAGEDYISFAPDHQYDSFTGRKLIDWNHTYTVSDIMSSTLSSYGITNMHQRAEGIYKINPRNVTLSVPGGVVESRRIDNTPTDVYVYYKPYSAKAITYTEVLAFMNSYIALDDTAMPIGAELGFNHIDMTCEPTPPSIINTQEYYMLDVSDIAEANPNFNILYPNVIYEISKLTVELSIVAVNGTEGSSMVYGTGYDNLTFELDFFDEEAFIAALGLDIAPHQLNISDYTNRPDGDPLRFFINNNVYQLLNASQVAVYSTSNSNNPAIPKGEYTPNVLYMAEYSQNFYFTFVPTIFTVKPKVITLQGIERTYFRDDKKFSYQVSNQLSPSEQTTVNGLLSEVMAKFIDISGVGIASNAGTFVQGDAYYGRYFLRALKNDIDTILVQARYINYAINYLANDICDLIESGNSAYTYMGLTIKKQSLKVRIAKPDTTLGESVNIADSISMTFGENLSGSVNRYEIYISGFATLDQDAIEYIYSEEEAAQFSVRTFIISDILRLSELFARMSIMPYNFGQLDTLNLSEYYDTSYSLQDYFTNYTIDLDKVYYVINKIDIYLNLINLSNENSPFEATYTELESFVYSDNNYNPTRLDMDIEIVNKADIIGYDAQQTYSLIDLFMLMNLCTELGEPIIDLTMLAENIEYVITQNGSNFYVYNTIVGSTGKKATDGVKTSAGPAKLALTNEATNKWYFCLGYNIICNPSDLIVYPEVEGLGDREATTFQIPYSGVALVGIPQDEENFKENLSVYVKLNYLGNPDMEWEYVDIKIPGVSDEKYYNNYYRSWTIIVLSDASEIMVGNEIRLQLTYEEIFFMNTAGEKINTITSNEFNVRLYGAQDVNLIDGNSYFTYLNNTINYGDEISGNHTYTLGTYVPNPNGDYLVKNWRGTNYYTQILPSLRYNYEPYLDANGQYVKVGDDYYLIVAKDRYDAHYSGYQNGQYLEVVGAGDCVPQYVEIKNELRYIDEQLTQPDEYGNYLKYTCPQGHDHALLITAAMRRTRNIVYNPNGQFMLIEINGLDFEVELKSDNIYTLYKQSDSGDYLKVDIYSNIYYETITDEKRYEKADFVGSYDVLDTRFRMDPNSNITNYYLDIVIFNYQDKDLFIRINNQGYYLYLGTDILDSQASIDELDLFDSFSHSVTFYIDKIGYYDRIAELRNYYVIIIIDDCYYLKLETGYANIEFGQTLSYAKVVTNEINITFTKFETIAMGISTFSSSNYIGDILLLPSAERDDSFKNYSYHITIPSASMEEIEIDVTKLFDLGSINSVFGYNPDNYYFDYYVNDELIHSTSKTKPVGLPKYGFARGIYNLTIKMYIKYTNDPTLTYYEQASKTIKLSVSQNYSRIALPEQGQSTFRAPSVAEPIVYSAGEHNYEKFISQGTTDITYNKIVFDFEPNSNYTDYYLRFILKTSDYAIDMLNDIPQDEYYGLMLEHSGTLGVGNSTKLYMRNGETLWVFDIGEMLLGDTDAWIGSRNVFEVLYVENNGYLILTLSRGTTRIFSQKIYNNCPIGVPNVSRADISNIINTDRSYTAVHLHNAMLNIYKYEVGYRMLGPVDFVDNSDNSFISGVSNIESNTKVLVSSGDGTAYTSTAKSFYIKFKASALEGYNFIEGEEFLRFVVVNNTARLMPNEPYNASTLTSDRGIYLSIVNKSKTQRELRMYMYKYDKIYKDQVLFTFNIGQEDDLLNGKEHFIQIDMSHTEIFSHYVEGAISCYRMYVDVGYYDEEDKPVYSRNYAYYPVGNNMSAWTLVTDSPLKDEEADDGNRDMNFVSNVVYSGIITLNSTILVEELSIC